MSSQGGRIFSIDMNTNLVEEETPFLADGITLDINNPTLPISWSENAENYWILQNNEDLPLIFNGSAAVRSNQALSQVPVGNVMCYAQGRLSVALPDRISFRVGDLVFGSSGTVANQYRDAMLYFTENNFLNEAGDLQARVFGAPSNFGYITAMFAAAQPDTQLGQGPLMVGQQYQVFTIQLPFDRTTWKNLTQPQQTTTPILGPLGQSSTIQVNTDIWYRAIDGIRSYIMAQRGINSGPGMTPMSSEIGDILDADTTDLLENGSAVLFDNRLLMTVSPVNSPYGVWHRGLAVIDFNLVSTLRGKTAPAWEGIWTGLRILKIVKGMVNKRERCFIYALDPNNNIVLYELSKTALYDNVSDPILWSLDTPSYNCGDSDNFKRLETGRLIVSNIQGTFSGVVKYRTDESPCYQPWTAFLKCAPVQDCAPPLCSGPHSYREQSRQPIKFPMPPDTFDPIIGRMYRVGYEFQIRMELSGQGFVRQFRIYAIDQPEMLSPERNAL